MIVWVDTETTGLDPESGDLLEVALVVTDDDLDEVAAETVVTNPITPHDFAGWKERLDQFIVDMHTKSGLLAAIERGEGSRKHEAEALLIAFARRMADGAATLASYATPLPDKSLVAQMLKDFLAGCIDGVLKSTPLAGSTVGFDRAWLKRHMSKLESMFSYRSIDVSSFTELAKRWSPAVYEGRPKAAGAHRALADVRESISYLRYYRDCGFVGDIK